MVGGRRSASSNAASAREGPRARVREPTAGDDARSGGEPGARHAAGLGLRSAWYAAQFQAAKRQSGGLDVPGEPEFRPSRGRPDLAELRKAYFRLFLQDRANVEAGLYPPPESFNPAGLPTALWQQLGLQAGGRVRITQGQGSVTLVAREDTSLAEGIVRVAAGHQATASLGAMFGPLTVERA